MTTILIVEDERLIAKPLAMKLQFSGFEVKNAYDGAEALAMMADEKFDLVLLDLMMPEMDGIAACEEIRRIPALQHTMIAFLTARGEDYSQIAGFEAGADDYINKPIKPKLFISRIKALLRRYKEVPAINDIISLKEFIIDKNCYVMIKNSTEISLVRKQFELLQFLVSRINEAVTRDVIFTQVWGEDIVAGDRTIDVHILRIREKLGMHSNKAIKGVGYKFDKG